MYFKCDYSKITVEQLATISAVSTLFHEQNMGCMVLSLDPLTFELKPQLSQQMRQRLIVDRVPYVAQGFVGQVEGKDLVVSKEADESAKGRGQRARKSNTDLRAS